MESGLAFSMWLNICMEELPAMMDNDDSKEYTAYKKIFTEQSRPCEVFGHVFGIRIDSGVCHYCDKPQNGAEKGGIQKDWVILSASNRRAIYIWEYVDA